MRFTADRFSWGDPNIDKDFQLVLKSCMSSKVTSTLPEDQWPARAEEAICEEGSLSVSSSGGTQPAVDVASPSGQYPTQALAIPQETAQGSSSSSSHEAGSSSAPVAVCYQNTEIHCHIDLSFTMKVLHPLSLVPGLLLQYTGNTITRFAIQALLPNFLDLLAVDYQRWAQGTGMRGDAAGSLVTPGPPLDAAVIDGDIDTLPSSGVQSLDTGLSTDSIGEVESSLIEMHTEGDGAESFAGQPTIAVDEAAANQQLGDDKRSGGVAATR